VNVLAILEKKTRSEFAPDNRRVESYRVYDDTINEGGITGSAGLYISGDEADESILKFLKMFE